MNRIVSSAVLLAYAGAGIAAQDFTDVAQVVSSMPIVERITEPRQECWQESAAGAPSQERSMVAPILGGVAGALLGSQVGRGSGKTAATAAGAVVGSVVGDRVANPDSDRPVTGAVVGGAAGGLLGAQVGSGSGRNAAAAAGAIGGAVVGDRVQNPQTASTQPGQRCRTVETTREIVKGYTVVYRYNGRDVTTTLPYNPGRTVYVGIGVVDGPAAAQPAPAGYPSAPPPPPPGAHRYPSTPAPVSNTGGYPYRY